MEKFSLDLLIQNAGKGNVTREIYIEKTLERMLHLPLAAFDSPDCMNEILEIFGMSYDPELCYMDLVYQADVFLRSESESEREQAYQAAEPLVRIFYPVYKRLGLYGKGENGRYMGEVHKDFALLPLYRLFPYCQQQQEQISRVRFAIRLMRIQNGDRELTVKDLVMQAKNILNRGGSLRMHEKKAVVCILFQSFKKVMNEN